ncbi:MAG: ribosome maturation factor RimP [Acidobacteriota bacterium]|nr:ribosome maturation factor RimP [Acidobacteriota bacterium]
MSRSSRIESEVEGLAQTVAESLGLEIYDLVFRRGGPRWKLQVFLDRPGGRVGLDDCEQVSRQLSRELDLLDPIPHAYDLEVSSPGMDRPLRSPRHWKKAEGQQVKVRLREPGGKVQTIVGRVLAADPAAARVEDEDGTAREISFDAVVSARIQPDW